MSARRLRLFHLLQLAAHKLQKEADREISSVTNLTTAQAAVLSAVKVTDGTTQKQVAIALGQNESAITAMVARLERLSYISKTRNRHDPRAWQLSITDTGLDAIRETKRPFSRINKLIESELEPDEVLALADMLKRLSKRVDEAS